MGAKSHAVVMTKYGAPDVLTYAEISLAALAPDEVRIRSIASAINHTDLEIRAGNWPVIKADPFPYVPGVEVVGEVEAVGAEVRALGPGDRVITMMQGLGGVLARRAGGYAEHVTVAANTVAKLRPGVDVYDIAAFGLAGVTAYEGLGRMGAIAGKRIVVTGAAGGVGSAAIAIARAQGATVTAVITRPDQSRYVSELGADTVVISPRGGPAARLDPQSADGVLDCVGGELFQPCVQALRAGGVLSLVGAVAGGDVRFDAWQLLRPVILTGYASEELDGKSLGNVVDDISDWLTAGRIRPPGYIKVPFAQASVAHDLLERREIHGRVLLVP